MKWIKCARCEGDLALTSDDIETCYCEACELIIAEGEIEIQDKREREDYYVLGPGDFLDTTVLIQKVGTKNES